MQDPEIVTSYKPKFIVVFASATSVQRMNMAEMKGPMHVTPHTNAAIKMPRFDVDRTGGPGLEDIQDLIVPLSPGAPDVPAFEESLSEEEVAQHVEEIAALEASLKAAHDGTSDLINVRLEMIRKTSLLLRSRFS